MNTYYRDFTTMPPAWEYAAGRTGLGHNVRLMSDGTVFRVFFSAVHCDIHNAIDIKTLP